MHDFKNTRIILWGIAKHKANILIHLQKYGNQKPIPINSSSIPINDCKGYYLEFT